MNDNRHANDYVIGSYLIGVVCYGNGVYRATTNNEEVYEEVVASLPWRDTREEAQADLDKVAEEREWKRYDPAFKSSWEIT